MSLPVFQATRQPAGPFGHTPGQWLVSAALLFCIAVGTGVVMGRLWTDPAYQLTPIMPDAEQAEVAAVRLKAEHQVAALTAKVASLQAQVNRLNMVGERLIETARLPADQLNLREAPAMGGPLLELKDQVVDSRDILKQLTSLEAQLEQEQNRFSLLESIDLHHHIGIDSLLSGSPLNGGYVSSAFGARTDPFTGEAAIHQGVDFAAAEGSAVYTTAAGVVTWAGERFGYGKMVEVEHAGGYRTRYAHAKSVKVQVGQLVTKGQQVATLGNTGRSTGPHVHYEVLKNGAHIDPMIFVNYRAQNFYGFAKTDVQSQR